MKGDKAVLRSINQQMELPKTVIKLAEDALAQIRLTEEKYIANVYGKSAIPLSRKIASVVASSTSERSEAEPLRYAVRIDFMTTGK